MADAVVEPVRAKGKSRFSAAATRLAPRERVNVRLRAERKTSVRFVAVLHLASTGRAVQ